MTVLRYDIEALAKDAHGTLYIDPKNHWNGPSIYVSRNYGKEASWQFRLSHASSSSGENNEDSLLATEFLVLQLRDAIDTMRDMMMRSAEFEAAYQAHRAAKEAEFAAERAAKQAKIDADTRIGSSTAAHIVATVCVDHKHGGKYKSVLRFRARGSDRTVSVVARTTSGGAVQFKINGTLVKKAEVIERIADFAEALVDQYTVA